MNSVPPSVPTSPIPSHSDKMPPHHYDAKVDSRSMKLEQLRDALAAAHIPLTKRPSLSKPQPNDSCELIPGTTRCRLPLCEEGCRQSHQHHTSHAKPLPADAPLIYSRPSVTMAQGVISSYASPAESPAASMPASANTSPHHTYRRASAFGFNFGTGRSSVLTAALERGMSGMSTPADVMSGPPSPTSEFANMSLVSSAQNSPRPNQWQQGGLMQYQPTQPTVQEGTEVASSMQQQQPTQNNSEQASGSADVPSSSLDASSSSSSSSPPLDPSGLHLSTAGSVTSTQSAPLNTPYWKLGNHIVNLNDYVPPVVHASPSEEARTRTDLRAAPRDDFPDQVDYSWDPRSPHPPSPVNIEAARLLRVHMNQQDPTRPEVEYVVQPWQQGDTQDQQQGQGQQ